MSRSFLHGFPYLMFLSLDFQLADFVKVPLERAGGMIALIDVYCLFNLARGTGFTS